MYTVISSFRNESSNCSNFFKMISESKKYIKISEIIAVDNGSSDDTYELLNSQKIENISIKVLKNDKNSGYGDGFSKAFIEASNKYVITIHSDNQYRLDLFLSKYSENIQSDIENDINIFPIRINRSLVSNKRTLLVRILLSIITLSLMKDYGGHPKFLVKDNFKNIKFYPSGIAFDAAIVDFIKKSKYKYTHNYFIEEQDRLFGVSSWSKDLIKQFFLFGKFFYEFIKFRFINR